MPAIEYVTDVNDSNSGLTSITQTLLSVEGPSLLVATFVTSFSTFPTDPIVTSVADNAVNTWRQLARTVNLVPPSAQYVQVETWVAVPTVDGDADVLATATGGAGTQSNAIWLAWFQTTGAILRSWAQGGFYERVTDSPRDAYGPSISMPGPGLLWSAVAHTGTCTPLADGFTDLGSITASGFNLRTAYAIEPQPTTNKRGFNFTANGDFQPTLTAFRDLNDSLSDDYPVQLGGRGAL